MLKNSDQFCSRPDLIPDEVAHVRKIFHESDSNGDGVLNINELSELSFTLDHFLDVDAAKAVVQSQDKDGDGGISFEEFQQNLM